MQFLEQIREKSPHERRGHALQLALGLMALVVLGWIVMLPVRFANIIAAQSAAQQDAAQTAGAVNSQTGNATLLVATSSDSQY